MEATDRPLRVVIVGAGSIGGLLAVSLSHLPTTTVSVEVIARGQTLESIQANNGIRLLRPNGSELLSSPNTTFVPDLRSVTDPATLNFVVLAVKNHQILPLLPDLARLLEVCPKLHIMTTQNGVPWFLLQGLVPPAHAHLSNTAIDSVDPGGQLLSSIPAERIIGCAVYPAASIVSRGTIRHTEGNRFPIGPVVSKSSTASGAALELSGLLIAAGFKSPVLDDIVSELWLKLWGSAAFNPISALTHGTLGDIATYPATRGLVVEVMEEVNSLAQALGLPEMRVPKERRIDGAAKVGAHKTSTCQDVEEGRVMELESLLGALLELSQKVALKVPCTFTLYCLTQGLQRTMTLDGCRFPPVKL